jgi:RNA polymerase sigma-70 factor (ECF subfamily)
MNERDRLARLAVERAAGLALYASQWLNAAAAEDAVQEALVALLGERVAPADPVAWMFRAVRNAAIDQARATTRRRRREQAVARAEWFQPSIENAIDARSAERALRHLAEVDREIVVLRIWGGLGFAQIADVTRMSLSTVHAHYVAALEKLRTTLEKPCPSQ